MRESMQQLEKMRRIIQKICVLLDLVAAVLVLVAILLSIASIVRDVSVFQRLLTDTSEFKRYLEQIFMLVIGIEFLGMLLSQCRAGPLSLRGRYFMAWRSSPLAMCMWRI